MKKRIMAAIVGIAVMMFGTTAFAAESPTAGSTKADTTVAAGQTVETDVQAPTEKADSMAKTTTVDDKDVAVKAVADTTVTEATTATKNLLTDVKKLGETLGDKTLAAAAADSSKKVSATVLSVVNLESTATGKTVVLKNSAIKAGKTYAVLHYTNGAWVTIPATVTGDGALSFKVDNFSPFAIVEIGVQDKTTVTTPAAPAAPATPAATPAADNKSDQAASPKTGETMPAAVLAMLVCAAGAVVCARKKEN